MSNFFIQGAITRVFKDMARHLVILGLVFLAGTIPARAEVGPVDWPALELVSIDGAPLPAETLDDKVVLLVNTASFCGFTHQYDGLQALWRRYRDRDFVLLGVPSNDFGGQEPGTEDEIKRFCEVNFAIDFPMTEKMAVKGPDAHALYRWAAEATGPDGVPRWNFHKILIGRDGRLAAWFPTRTAPDDPALTAAIESVLERFMF